MRRISHREFRNNSAAILREVQAGESMEITNNGEVVAVLSPPPSDVLSGFKVRRATRPIPMQPLLPPVSDGEMTASELILLMREEDRKRLDPR
jgi:hypothetical protein